MIRRCRRTCRRTSSPPPPPDSARPRENTPPCRCRPGRKSSTHEDVRCGRVSIWQSRLSGPGIISAGIRASSRRQTQAEPRSFFTIRAVSTSWWPVIVVHDPHERDDCRPDHDRPHWGEQLPDQWREHHREIPLQRPPVPVGNRPLHPGPHRRGGCLLVYGNGGDLPISGNVTMAWQAFAVEGGDHPLTVIELT